MTELNEKSRIIEDLSKDVDEVKFIKDLPPEEKQRVLDISRGVAMQIMVDKQKIEKEER